MQATFFGPAIADAGTHSVRLSQDIALGSGVHSTDPETRTPAEAAAATSDGGEGAAPRISFWTRAMNTLEVQIPPPDPLHPTRDPLRQLRLTPHRVACTGRFRRGTCQQLQRSTMHRSSLLPHEHSAIGHANAHRSGLLPHNAINRFIIHSSLGSHYRSHTGLWRHPHVLFLLLLRLSAQS